MRFPAAAWLFAAAVLVPALLLSACGKKGPLDAPKGNTYPRSYPYEPAPLPDKKTSPEPAGPSGTAP